jgi:hypothetical protein
MTAIGTGGEEVGKVPKCVLFGREVEVSDAGTKVTREIREKIGTTREFAVVFCCIDLGMGREAAGTEEKFVECEEGKSSQRVGSVVVDTIETEVTKSREGTEERT